MKGDHSKPVEILIFPSAYFDTNGVSDGQHEWGVGGVGMGIWIESGGFWWSCGYGWGICHIFWNGWYVRDGRQEISYCKRLNNHLLSNQRPQVRVHFLISTPTWTSSPSLNKKEYLFELMIITQGWLFQSSKNNCRFYCEHITVNM